MKEKKELLIWINYVEASMDTRDCMIWKIRFIIVNNVRREIVFRDKQGYDMKTEIYKFLNKTEQEVLEMNLKIVD